MYLASVRPLTYRVITTCIKAQGGKKEVTIYISISSKKSHFSRFLYTLHNNQKKCNENHHQFTRSNPVFLR